MPDRVENGLESTVHSKDADFDDKEHVPADETENNEKSTNEM